MKKASDLKIQRLGQEDLDAVVPLFDAYRRFYQQTSDPVAARSWLEQRLQRDEAVILLAEKAGVAAGFTLLYSSFSSVLMTRTHLLNDLYVAPGARRMGVGLALLGAAADFARSRGSKRISLETMRDNHAARALYRRACWHEDHTQWFCLELANNEPER